MLIGLFLTTNVAAGAATGGKGRVPPEGGFTEVVVDDASSGDCKALADVDGDGTLDGIIGGATLDWYRSPGLAGADAQRQRVAEASDEFTTDCQAADVDGDGRVDIIVPDGEVVLWFGNVDGGRTWERHEVGGRGALTHDLEVGDVDGDGHLDVVARNRGQLTLFTRSDAAAGPGSGASGSADAVRFDAETLSTRDGEGTGVGDVDGDGDLDILTGGWWLENTGRSGPLGRERWIEHMITDTDWGSIAVTDVDGDGHPDVVLGPMEDSGPIAWWSMGAGPGDWERHEIVGDSGGELHTFETADVDGDGRADLVAAAMFGDVTVYLNPGDGTAWPADVIADGGLHNLRVGDLDGDGDPDVFGSNFIGNPPVLVLRNDLSGAAAGATAASVDATGAGGDDAAVAGQGGGSGPSPWWWGLGAVVLVGVAALPLAVRRRRGAAGAERGPGGA